MFTFGRIAAAVLAAGALVAGTLVAAHYLKGPGSAPAAVPAVVETPTSAEGGGAKGVPARPADAASPVVAATGGAASIAAPAAGRPATAAGAQVPAGPAAAPEGATPAAGPGEAHADEGLAMVRDRPVQAQKRLSEAVRAGIDGPKGREVRQVLGALADKIQLSPRIVVDDPYSKSYTVAAGDALERIGQRHLVPYELVMRLNGMTTPAIAAGQQIKVIQGPINIEISKSRKELQAWLGDACIRVYPVGIGADDKTPDGTFVVTKNKLRNPPYQPQHKPKSEFKASGAPDNPLGTRWIDIGNHYGIHGTIDPASIGRDVSEGCIRMHNKDVEELFDMVVPNGSKVTIRP